MSYIKMFILLLRFVRWVQERLAKQGKLEAARVQAIKEMGEEADDLINAAIIARASVKHDPDSLLNDPHNVAK